MPKYIFDLEENLEFQRSISRELTDICETTECEDCWCKLLCTFNINATTQLYLLNKNKPLTNE